MGMTQVRVALAGLALSLVAAGSAMAAPSISSFTPATGSIGTHIIVNGSGFTGATAVKFNGIPAASYTVVSNIEISATAPNSVSTGPISVTAGGSTATSTTSFSVTPGMGLSVTGGPPTSTITVYGAGFHASNAVDLYIDNVDVALFVSSPTGTISAGYLVPASAQPGPHWITFVERGSNWAAQAVFTVNTVWAQEGFGWAGRGFNPYENTINTSNVATMTAWWSGSAGGFANLSPFVVGASGIFVGDVNGDIHAYSNTGARLWTASPGSDMQHVNPAVGFGLVFFGDSSGNVRGYSQNCRSDGGVCTPLWTTSVGTSVTAGLTVYNGTLYAPSSDGSIHPLNPMTGAAGTPIYGIDTTHGPVTTPVAFDSDGSFYYGAGDYLEFRTALGVQGDGVYNGTISPIAVSNGSAYFTTSDGMLHRYGNGTWDVPTSGTGCAAAPVVTLGYVYAGGCSTLGAYVPKTGSIFWNITSEQIIGVSEANGVLYVCEGPPGSGNLQAYDAIYGTHYWTGGDCNSAPEITNGNVYATFQELTAYNFPTVVGNQRMAPAISTLEPDYGLKPQFSGTKVAPSTE